MTENKRVGKWQPGESGNPKGKAPGSGELQRLRAAIAADVPEILASLVSAAKSGDVQAARLILERVLPPIRATEQAVKLQLPDGETLTAQGRAVLSAVAGGDLAPSQASQLLSSLGSLAKLVETDELSARIAALEGKANANPR